MREEEMNFRNIGVIHTPYAENSRVPYQPIGAQVEDEANFFVDVDAIYIEALLYLESFRYVYLLYHTDRPCRPVESIVQPPWAGGMRVGMFASRVPTRPNPIGLSVVRLLSVEGGRLFTSPLDVFDKTPLLDIKPYIRDLDSKHDANVGWVSGLPDGDHLMLHIKGIPHNY
jgi:tRNA (adenine37-N6)-methyltransferase